MQRQVQPQLERITLQTRVAPELPESETVISESQHPREIKWGYFKILSAGGSFFVAGVNDGSLGSIIPFFLQSYDVGTDMASIL